MQSRHPLATGCGLYEIPCSIGKESQIRYLKTTKLDMMKIYSLRNWTIEDVGQSPFDSLLLFATSYTPLCANHIFIAGRRISDLTAQSIKQSHLVMSILHKEIDFLLDIVVIQHRVVLQKSCHVIYNNRSVSWQFLQTKDCKTWHHQACIAAFWWN